MNKTEARKIAKSSTRYGYMDRGSEEGSRVFETPCPVRDCNDKIRAYAWVGDVRTPAAQCKALHAAALVHIIEDH